MSSEESTDSFTSQRITASGASRTNASLPYRKIGDPSDIMQLGMADDHIQPTVWEAVHYPKEHEFTFDTFWLRYKRQSEATAIIDKPVDDTWQDDPEIKDLASENQDDDATQFEEAVTELLEGENTRRQPVSRLKAADTLARIGEYSFLVFGFGDGEGTPMEQPIAGPGGEGSGNLNGPEDLHYVAPYGQDRVVDIELDTDMSSPRYMQPEYVELVTQDPDDEDLVDVAVAEEFETQKIHWTRFLHIPEGELEDDLRGTPALKPVFHELLNIDKIKAASGEGYWRAGYQGLVVRPPEIQQAGGGTQRGQFADDGDGVKKEIREFLDNFERTIATTGEIEAIDSSVGDPASHLDIQYRGIEVALDMPRSVFVGADRADTADSQAAQNWHATVAQRRRNHAESNLVEPFVQRLIDVGVLPEPQGDGFTVEWPPLDETSEMEEAEILNTEAQAMRRVSPSNDVTHHWTTEEIRDKFGFHPERGMEVDEEFQPDEEDEEDEVEVDEAALQRMEEQARNPPEPPQPPGQQPAQQPPQQPPAETDGGEEEPDE